MSKSDIYTAAFVLGSLGLILLSCQCQNKNAAVEMKKAEEFGKALSTNSFTLTPISASKSSASWAMTYEKIPRSPARIKRDMQGLTYRMSELTTYDAIHIHARTYNQGGVVSLARSHFYPRTNEFRFEVGSE